MVAQRGASRLGRSMTSRDKGHLTYVLFALPVAFPALAIGGVPSWTVPVFLLLCIPAWISTFGGSASARLPQGLWLGLLSVGITALQCLPMPSNLLSLMAPGLAELYQEALAHTAIRWGKVSAIPGETELELTRLVGLTVLFVLASRFHWRSAAGIVVFTGTVVALVGLVQRAFGLNEVYGLYSPRDTAGEVVFLTTFVNPNHQSGLFLLGIFGGIGLVVARSRREKRPDTIAPNRRIERRLLLAISVSIQAYCLSLSASRGAIAVLLMFVPIVGILVWRDHRRRYPRAFRRRAALAACLVGLVVLVLAGKPEVISELGTVTGEQDGFKYSTVRDAVSLVSLSPIVGTGRGTFVDLFPTTSGFPGGRLFARLESVPVAMVVEWGPLFGGTIVVGVFAWLVATGLRVRSGGRLVLVSGLAALLLQNFADFNLEFLGVAAPSCAIAGSLASRRPREWDTRRVRLGGVLVLVVAAGVGARAMSGTWSSLRDEHAAVASGRVSATEALSRRPLDARVHLALARNHVVAGELEDAKVRALVATRLAPDWADGWFVLGGIAFALGDDALAEESLRRALARLTRVPEPAAVAYLASRYTPSQLAALAPPDVQSWRLLLQALSESHLDHAEALAAAREAENPLDPVALRFRTTIELRRRRAGLALHHARLWKAVAPTDHRAHQAVVLALRRREGKGVEAQVQKALDEALAAVKADQAWFEQQLVQSYLRDGSPQALARAEVVARRLTSRAGDPKTRRERRSLLREVARRRSRR